VEGDAGGAASPPRFYGSEDFFFFSPFRIVSRVSPLESRPNLQPV
jgi:hypothetical protein